MTEQPPSAEARKIAERHAGRWQITDAAREIDALCKQRVSAERAQAARWHDEQYRNIRDNPLGPEGLHTALQGAHMAAHSAAAEHFRAPAERPAPPQPKSMIERYEEMTRQPVPYEGLTRPGDMAADPCSEASAQEPDQPGCGDHRLPCDVWVRHMRFGKGVRLQTLADAAARWLTAAQQADSRNRWQPIETAPRDGTKFDAWQRDERVTDVYWSDIQEAWCIDGNYGPEEPTPLAIFPPVTHWMRLPVPPTDASGSPAPSPETTAAPSSALCARCGQPRREHSHSGACYGLCGEFVEPSHTPPAPMDYTERARSLIEKYADFMPSGTIKRQFSDDLAAAVASEREAALQLAEAKVAQLSETAGEDYSVGFEAATKALLARLGEPEMREAVLEAIKTAYLGLCTYEAMAEAALDVVRKELT